MQQYIDHYVAYEKTHSRQPRADLLTGIFRQFKRAEKRRLTEDEIARLVFPYSEADDRQVRLTHGGSQRLLKDVAATYRFETSRGFTWPDNEKKVVPLRRLIATGGNIDAVFLRAKVHSEPVDGSFYIEDGVHRLVALAVSRMDGATDQLATAYIGHFT